MGGRDPADRDMDGIMGWLTRLSNALENKLAMLLVSAALASAGTLGFVKTDPTTRADPFTGTQGAEHRAMIVELQKQVRDLELSQVLDDAHRATAIEGYARIRKLEERCNACAREQ
jgi:hypothetical protein